MYYRFRLYIKLFVFILLATTAGNLVFAMIYNISSNNNKSSDSESYRKVMQEKLIALLEDGRSSFKVFDGLPIRHELYEDIEKLQPVKIECRKEWHRRIPNVVHYVWFGDDKMNMMEYFAVRSAAVVQRPEKIIFHSSDVGALAGPWWKRLLQEVPCIEVKYKADVEHQEWYSIMEREDKARVEILKQYGGISADRDVMFVQPLDVLMDKFFVMGQLMDKKYGNNVMLSVKDSMFLDLLNKSYILFNEMYTDELRSIIPYQIHNKFTNAEFHLERYSLTRPNPRDGLDWFLHKNWDLRYSFCVPLFYHEISFFDELKVIFKRPEREIVSMDNTLGQLFRIAMYGSPYLKLTRIEKIMMTVHNPIFCGVLSAGRNHKIPNILHYIWNGEDILFNNYLSVRSAVQMIRPAVVLFHMRKKADPFSINFLKMLREITCFRMVNGTHLGQPRTELYSSNKDKLLSNLQVLKEHGGIVLDLNVTVIQPFYDLLENSLVVGRNNGILDIDVMMAMKGSKAIENWFSSVKSNQFASVNDAMYMQFSDDTLVYEDGLPFNPRQSWFEASAPSIPKVRAITLKQSNIKDDIKEEVVVTSRSAFGALARYIFFNLK